MRGGEWNCHALLALGWLAVSGAACGETTTPLTARTDQAAGMCRGCDGPWSFEIADNTFRELYLDYYDAAVQAHCRAEGMTEAECERFAHQESYTRTLPYYNPDAGILVTQADEQLARDEANLRYLLPGMTLTLNNGTGVLDELCGNQRVVFVTPEELADWQAENPDAAAGVYTVAGSEFTAVYCSQCYDALGSIEAGFFNTAVRLVLRNLDSTFTDMTNNISTLPPNAPFEAACETDEECEARPLLDSVDNWTNSRCVFSDEVQEFKCVEYSIEHGKCPGPGSDGRWEWDCDEGLTCVRVFTARRWPETNKYACRRSPPRGQAGCTHPRATNYASSATWDDGSCRIRGCTDTNASNHDPEANVDDGSCRIFGCTDRTASNYNPAATVDNGSCRLAILGCTDCTAHNFDPNATVDDGSCDFGGCTDPHAINYDPVVVHDDGSCVYSRAGCTDPFASNFDATATDDDGSCSYVVYGCTDPFAANYNRSATNDDGSCTYTIYGCTVRTAYNYNPAATVDDLSCDMGGCTDPFAANYDPNTAYDDGSCTYESLGCMDPTATNFDPSATVEDYTCEYS